MNSTNSRHTAMSRSARSAVVGTQNAAASSAGLSEKMSFSAVTSTSDWHIWIVSSPMNDRHHNRASPSVIGSA
ncbi:hypothetical protein E1294_46705 [Nonomuraea diastatica]|uniref:Uncharacterized protein n=1 Tax=Nonomuraea diastatica TaxID=1848329 RepID=A0A4R4VUA5_9ACTN|nr:hypothetical protein E1294_46705 [Nonomuraea diastatica]